MAQGGRLGSASGSSVKGLRWRYPAGRLQKPYANRGGIDSVGHVARGAGTWPNECLGLLDRLCLRARIPVEGVRGWYRSRPHAVGGVNGGLAALGAPAKFGDNRRSRQ